MAIAADKGAHAVDDDRRARRLNLFQWSFAVALPLFCVAGRFASPERLPIDTINPDMVAPLLLLGFLVGVLVIMPTWILVEAAPPAAFWSLMAIGPIVLLLSRTPLHSSRTRALFAGLASGCALGMALILASALWFLLVHGVLGDQSHSAVVVPAGAYGLIALAYWLRGTALLRSGGRQSRVPIVACLALIVVVAAIELANRGFSGAGPQCVVCDERIELDNEPL